MRRTLSTLAVMVLAACAPAAPQATRGAVMAERADLPPPRRFTGTPDLPVPIQPNAQLARDFMALSFRLETGVRLDTFTRFEGPVTVAVEGRGPLPPTLDPDLDDLLERLRTEAGIEIDRAEPGKKASITVSVLPRATLARHVPGAACFVVPRVSGWADYLARRRSDAVDWTTLATRSRTSVFLPADVSPQEIRDCLHEELAQALGPLNDLYRLPHSVFNDDNMHVALTEYDMTILRATYDPRLASGMSSAAVAARLPAILAEINPRGRDGDGPAIAESDPGWTAALRGALDPGGADATRLTDARRAVTMAETAGWGDGRLAMSHLARGRAALSLDGDEAVAAFLAAERAYERAFGEGLQTAQITVQMVAFALSSGQADVALPALDRAIPAARGGQNAALLATLLLMRAEAIGMLGDVVEARAVRREGLAWGRYAWGDAVLLRQTAEVASLRPAA
ncbi:DUF2927 domain-containing protein [uncultured Jannaschia sp.]|uniref:DUF2927 domain-containing protein n=1 Tax=uncultured Jannaschia sp. TaxID=293347 RepID=UPI002617AA44|nr:DUF2927 domain-containing protein [uncultured Jannaschia sp.]